MDWRERGKPYLCYIAFVIATLFLPEVSAIAKECTACKAVAGELRDRVEKEKPKNHLDLRNRLDSEGNRYGKVIEFKLSELRVLELLEGLCDSMSDYEFAASPAGNDTQAVWQWVKSSDIDLKDWNRLGKPEKLTRRKELENYCGRLIEQHEDAISAALRKPEFAPSDLDSLFCSKLTKACMADTKPAEKTGSDEL